MKKLLSLSLVALLSMTLFVGCSSKEETTTEEPTTSVEEPATEEATLVDGTYNVEGSADSQGWVATAEVVIAGGEITAITFDATDAAGGTKSEAVANGSYDMSVAGAQDSWTGEMATFADAIIAGSVDLETIAFDADGKSDAVSGVTVTVQPYVELVKAALEQAA